jgi:endonuclease/exonuclease/phosphatase family metal-dependent hydrolase
MRRILRYFFIVVVTLTAVLALILIYAQHTYYEPDEVTIVFTGEKIDTMSETTVFSVLTWNIGYAGLDKDMDFFYDGGKQVRSSREQTLKNLEGILSFIQSQHSTDFFFFQEVDRASRRSYYLDMTDSIAETLPDTHQAFAKNYDVRFVPVPWYSPMGKVSSGLLTAGTHTPSLVKRYSFPGSYPWPDRLFSLQRCFLMNRYPLSNGKELVLINTHNSAFDEGQLRKIQMDYMKSFILEEYELGNYVIAGGDFNQCPPDFNPDFYFNIFDDENVMYIPDDFLLGWHFVYDANMPTNRRVHTPYNPATTKTTLIDFFIASPNIKPLKVEGIHLDFQHSDHNPVIASFQLPGPYIMQTQIHD